MSRSRSRSPRGHHQNADEKAFEHTRMVEQRQRDLAAGLTAMAQERQAQAGVQAAFDDDEDAPSTNAKCWMEIAINKNNEQEWEDGPVDLYYLEVLLFRRVCPQQCKRFMENCQKGTYEGCEFFRIIPQFCGQTGDIQNNDGTGVDPITFDDESFQMKHDRAGLLSAANQGKDTNGSQFFFTFRNLPHLDRRHQVFGEIVFVKNCADKWDRETSEKPAFKDMKETPQGKMWHFLSELEDLGNTRGQVNAGSAWIVDCGVCEDWP